MATSEEKKMMLMKAFAAGYAAAKALYGRG
jgi:hypothetical protein